MSFEAVVSNKTGAQRTWKTEYLAHSLTLHIENLTVAQLIVTSLTAELAIPNFVFTFAVMTTSLQPTLLRIQFKTAY